MTDETQSTPAPATPKVKLYPVYKCNCGSEICSQREGLADKLGTFVQQLVDDPAIQDAQSAASGVLFECLVRVYTGQMSNYDPSDLTQAIKLRDSLMDGLLFALTMYSDYQFEAADLSHVTEGK